jgi:hypothetical protein
MKHSLILITQTGVRPFLLLAIFVSVFTTVQAQNNSAAPRKRQVSDIRGLSDWYSAAESTIYENSFSTSHPC